MLRTLIFYSTLNLVLVTSMVGFAQENTQKKEGIFNSREEYGEFFRKLREFDDPELNKLLPVINDVILASHGLKKPSFGSPFNSQRSWMLKILENKSVREEIEMMDYQFEDIKTAGATIQNRMADRIKAVLAEQSVGEIDPKTLVREVNDIRDSAEKEMDEILLPKQLKRLRQVLLNAWIKRESPIKVITSPQIAEELEISDDQKDELRNEWKSIQKKMNEDIAAIKAKAKLELVSRLDRGQRRKFEDMFGDDFDIKPDKSDKNDDANDKERQEK